jgi:peptide deformylase
MAIRDVVTIPEPILRKKARKVTEFGLTIHTLIDDMVETMRVAPGVGLAAPQVNEPLNVIVVEFGDENDENAPLKLYSIVNPEITRFSRKKDTATEGCLSIPGILGDVERPFAITIKGLNRHGQPVRIKAEGWLARIFQHEVDHLNGVLFIDHAVHVWKVEDQPAQVVPVSKF